MSKDEVSPLCNRYTALYRYLNVAILHAFKECGIAHTYTLTVFITIYSEAVYLSRLKGVEVGFQISYRKLAEEICISLKQLQREIALLKKGNWIEVNSSTKNTEFTPNFKRVAKLILEHKNKPSPPKKKTKQKDDHDKEPLTPKGATYDNAEIWKKTYPLRRVHTAPT